MKKFTGNKIVTLLFAAVIICIANSSAFSQQLVDSFEYTNAEDSMARIDNFVVQMQNDPNATGFLIIYGGKVNKKGEVDAHIKQIPNYLKLRGVDKNQFVIMNGGFREKLSWDFFLVNAGDTPEPEPTVEAKDVKTKGKFSKKNNSLYICCE